MSSESRSGYVRDSLIGAYAILESILGGVSLGIWWIAEVDPSLTMMSIWGQTLFCALVLMAGYAIIDYVILLTLFES